MIYTVRELKKRNRAAVNIIKHYNPTHLKCHWGNQILASSMVIVFNIYRCNYTYRELIKRTEVVV